MVKQDTRAPRQHNKFTTEDKRGKQANKFRKVSDALGRKVTAVESRRLKAAGYNPRTHSVSIKRLKSGKLTFSVKKRRTPNPKK